MRPAHRTLIRHAMRHMGFLTEEIQILDRDFVNIIESNGLQQPHQLRNPMYIFVDLMLIGVLTPGPQYKMNTTAVMAMAGSAIRIQKDSTANNISRSQSRATAPQWLTDGQPPKSRHMPCM